MKIAIIILISLATTSLFASLGENQSLPKKNCNKTKVGIERSALKIGISGEERESTADMTKSK